MKIKEIKIVLKSFFLKNALFVFEKKGVTVSMLLKISKTFCKIEVIFPPYSLDPGRRD